MSLTLTPQRQRPLLATSEDALVGAVASPVAREPGRPVALVVDGLAHVTRIRNDSVGFDASRTIAEALAALELPPGSALIVLSQPGGYLQPLLDGARRPVEVPGLTRPELADLAKTLGMPAAPATATMWTTRRTGATGTSSSTRSWSGTAGTRCTLTATTFFT